MVSPSFGVYLVLDYPNRHDFTRFLEAAGGCMDFVELGLPSPRPKYDGPAIREAHRLVLARSPKDPVRALNDLPPAEGKATILMGYLEDLGLEGLLKALRRAKSLSYVSVLLPDLAFDYPEYMEHYVEVARVSGLRPSFFASSKFPHRLLGFMASTNPLFIYLGLQPSSGVELPISVERNVRIARSLIGDAFLLVGFSVRRPETVRRLIEAGADAVVVGSEVARKLREGLWKAVSYTCELYKAAHGG